MNDDGRHRLGLIAVAALSLFGALFARLWFLQVVEGESLEAAAARNATRPVVIPAPRGRILDRNGIVLVDNRESIVVGIDWQEFNQMPKGRQDRVLRALSKNLSYAQPVEKQVTVEFLRKRLNDSRFSHFRPVPVAEDITPEQEILLREASARFPSVVVDHQTVRTYPNGSLAAHVLGYVGAINETEWERLKGENHSTKPYTQTDEIGKAGVEATYEKYLRGTPGRRVYEVDRQNRVVGEIASERVEPKPGDDLYLSIDARVQAEVERALRSTLDERRQTSGTLGYYKAEAGAMAAVDPTDGGVVAMASYPTYDPNLLVGGISCPEWRDLQGLPSEGSCKDVTKEIEAIPTEDRPVSKLVNRALAGTYPPGSTFKLATAFAASELGMLTPNTTISDPGYYEIPDCGGDRCTVRSPAAESGGLGSVDLARSLTASSDTYYYKLGNDSWALHKQRGQVPADALQRGIRKLGFGEQTGVDLPSEAAGRVPDPAWLEKFDKALHGRETENGTWRSGNSINLSIGQGDVLSTPLQLANAYAAFANRGTLYRPSVMSRITRSGQPDQVVARHQPKVIRKIQYRPDIYDAMLRGFEGVTKAEPDATARQAFLGFDQDTWGVAGKTGTAQSGTREHPKPDHSWFVGWGPTAEPRYVVASIMEHSGFGGSASAPAVRRVLEAIATGSLDQIDLASLADPTWLGADKVGGSAEGDTDGDGVVEGDDESIDGEVDGDAGTSTSTTIPGSTTVPQGGPPATIVPVPGTEGDG